MTEIEDQLDLDLSTREPSFVTEVPFRFMALLWNEIGTLIEGRRNSGNCIKP